MCIKYFIHLKFDIHQTNNTFTKRIKNKNSINKLIILLVEVEKKCFFAAIVLSLLTFNSFHDGIVEFTSQ